MAARVLTAVMSPGGMWIGFHPFFFASHQHLPELLQAPIASIVISL